MKWKKNKYYYRSHISEKKFRELIRCFGHDFNTLDASKVTGISHRTCKIIYAKLRIHIAKFCTDDRPDSGEFECDESYFDAKRVRGVAEALQVKPSCLAC